MEDSNNHDSRFFNPVIDTERETMNQSTPSVPMNARVDVWCFSNHRKNFENLIKELVTQTWPLFLIPTCGIR